MPVNKEIKFHQIERTEETKIDAPKKPTGPDAKLIALGSMLFIVFASIIAVLMQEEEKPQRQDIVAIEKDLKKRLEKDLSSKLKKDLTAKIEKSLSARLEKEISEKLEKEILARLEKDISEKLGKNISEKLGKDISKKLGKDISERLEKKISGMIEKNQKNKIKNPTKTKQNPKSTKSKPKTKKKSRVTFRLSAKDWHSLPALINHMQKSLDTFVSSSKTLYLTRTVYIFRGKDKKPSITPIATRIKVALKSAINKHKNFKLVQSKDNSRIYARYLYKNNTLVLLMFFYDSYKSRSLVKFIVNDLKIPTQSKEQRKKAAREKKAREEAARKKAILKKKAKEEAARKKAILKKKAREEAARKKIEKQKQTRLDQFKKGMESKIGNYKYNIFIDKNPAGNQTLAITRLRQNRIQVKSVINLKYTVAFVFSYSYKQNLTEVWKGHTLYSVSGWTNDDGEQSKITVVTKGKKLIVLSDYSKNVLPPLGTDLSWNFMDLDRYYKEFPLINTQTSKIEKARYFSLGTQTLKISGRSIKCKGFRFTKDNSEVWFNEKGVLVRTKTLTQGYTIEFILASRS